MFVNPIGLAELEHDALTEVVNIGMSRAASALRKMVGHQVLLSVPDVEIVTRQEAAILIGAREDAEMVAVEQIFSGTIAGRAMLIFPHAHSRELARAVVGEELSDEDLSDLEQEALAETGNVILNSCLATMANMLRRPLTMSIPTVNKGDASTLFREPAEKDEDERVLFLYINFSIHQRDLRGYIAMMVDMPSMQSLKELLAEFVEQVIGDNE